jgi:hypothetical protein
MTGSLLARRSAAVVLAALIALLCIASADNAPPPVIPVSADGTCPPGTEAAANLQTGAVECLPIPGAVVAAPMGNMPQGQITPTQQVAPVR